MASRSKRKGSRVERELVSLHEPLGVPCKRVPLSGAAEGFKGDLWLTLAGVQMTAEVKARANGTGFKTLEGWLGSNDLLFLRRDRATPIVLLPWETYSRLVMNSQDATGGKQS
ncbi:MAG: hypothetical protein U0796_10195 [Gemmatales bacterium]